MLRFGGGGCLEIVFPVELKVVASMNQCTKILGLTIY